MLKVQNTSKTGSCTILLPTFCNCCAFSEIVKEVSHMKLNVILQ